MIFTLYGVKPWPTITRLPVLLHSFNDSVKMLQYNEQSKRFWKHFLPNRPSVNYTWMYVYMYMVFLCYVLYHHNRYIPVFPIGYVNVNFPLANTYWFSPLLSKSMIPYHFQAEDKDEGDPIIKSTYMYTYMYMLTHMRCVLYSSKHFIGVNFYHLPPYFLQ